MKKVGKKLRLTQHLLKKHDKAQSKNGKPAGKPAEKPDPTKPKEKTLDDRIQEYEKKGCPDINKFLAFLPKEQREALWQRLSYAKQQSKELKVCWQESATGPGSIKHKKDILNAFLQNKQDPHAKAFVQHISTYRSVTGAKEEEEWVPFGVVAQRYGLAELLRRLSKGSIQTRMDPDDQEEWQFRLCTRKEFKTEEDISSKVGKRVEKRNLDLVYAYFC